MAKTFYNAMLAERDESGEIVSVRITTTFYRDEDAARKVYGDSFYLLLTAEKYSIRLSPPSECCDAN